MSASAARNSFIIFSLIVSCLNDEYATYNKVMEVVISMENLIFKR